MRISRRGRRPVGNRRDIVDEVREIQVAAARATIDPIADRLEAEPTRMWTGAELARMLREISARTDVAMGTERPREADRPE